MKKGTVLTVFLIAALVAGAGMAAARPLGATHRVGLGSYEHALRVVGDSSNHFRLWDDHRMYVLEGRFADGAFVGRLMKVGENGLEPTGQIVWGAYHGVRDKPFGAFSGFVDEKTREARFWGWFGENSFVVTNLNGGVITGHYETWVERPA